MRAAAAAGGGRTSSPRAWTRTGTRSPKSTTLSGSMGRSRTKRLVRKCVLARSHSRRCTSLSRTDRSLPRRAGTASRSRLPSRSAESRRRQRKPWLGSRSMTWRVLPRWAGTYAARPPARSPVQLAARGALFVLELRRDGTFRRRFRSAKGIESDDWLRDLFHASSLRWSISGRRIRFTWGPDGIVFGKLVPEGGILVSWNQRRLLRYRIEEGGRATPHGEENPSGRR